MNWTPACLKISVAQKLMIGHMNATVTEARTSVTNSGLSTPGVTMRNAILGARRSIKQNPMTKQIGNMNVISCSASGRAALVSSPVRRPVLYSSMASTMKKVISTP